MPKSKQAGYSLVSFMLAALLSLLLLGAGFYAVNLLVKGRDQQIKLSNRQQNLNLAAQHLFYMLQAQGLLCYSWQHINNYLKVLDAEAKELADFNVAPLAGSKVIMVPMVGLNAVMLAMSVKPGAQQVLLNGFFKAKPGDELLLEGCKHLQILQAASVQHIGQKTQLDFTEPIKFYFPASSELGHLRPYIFFVASSAHVAGQFSLYQKPLSGSKQELVDGIDDLQAEFGVDTNSDQQIDAYFSIPPAKSKVQNLRLKLSSFGRKQTHVIPL